MPDDGLLGHDHKGRKQAPHQDFLLIWPPKTMGPKLRELTLIPISVSYDEKSRLSSNPTKFVKKTRNDIDGASGVQQVGNSCGGNFLKEFMSSTSIYNQSFGTRERGTVW